ncbi:hypothetical protein J4Q44_G00020390 [Coregonus suidteri]|uniref:Uncharacterized protein n=1 Tax=Coregonus suidteri TaxID=861788 RepID=A0AAN8MB43_9TELE
MAWTTWLEEPGRLVFLAKMDSRVVALVCPAGGCWGDHCGARVLGGSKCAWPGDYWCHPETYGSFYRFGAFL